MISAKLRDFLVEQVGHEFTAHQDYLGIALYFPLSQARVGGVSLRFDTGAVAFWSALLLVLAVASAIASLRRVLRIDPIEATTGGGLR